MAQIANNFDHPRTDFKLLAFARKFNKGKIQPKLLTGWNLRLFSSRYTILVNIDFSWINKSYAIFQECLMATPKKGTRVISVDGVSYRWRTKHWSPDLMLAVWRIDPMGQHLRARFDEDRVITPSVVEFVIRNAISMGWQSEKLGMPAIVLDGDKLVAGTEFELSHPPNADIRW